jgi:D-proline reductase (dithiol) PrdB
VTRLTDLPPAQAQRLAEVQCPDFTTRPWVSGPVLSQRRVAIVCASFTILSLSLVIDTARRNGIG